MEASGYAYFWASVLAFAVLTYAILDGFDFGVGILFGTTRDQKLRIQMMDAIAPIWSGNETWLVLFATVLYAAFPAAYAVFLAAFYFPAMLLLFGLILRGISFELRSRTMDPHRLDNAAFFGGSILVAFVLGTAVGALCEGIPMENGRVSGGLFHWLALTPVLFGLGFVMGYALLGAGWLVFKCDGEARDWAYRRVPWLAAGTLLSLAIAFARLGGRAWQLSAPWLGLLALAGGVVSARLKKDRLTFSLIVVFVLAIYLAMMEMFWPYLIPYGITVSNAAAPDASLKFFMVAGVVVLPLIVGYTIYSYWVFRGKVGQR